MHIFKNIQKFALLFSLVILSFVLGGCGIDEDKETIYDDDQRIAQEGDSFSFYQRTGETDEKHVDIKYNRFYGVQTLWVIKTKDQSEINLNYNSQVNNGKFKVVLITPEREVINIAEQNRKGSFKVAVSKGKYSLKIVGNNANGAIRFEQMSQSS